MKKFSLIILSLLLGINISSATQHFIDFGGDFGFNYSPNSLQVSVGDTITWMGDFSFHPLVSVLVPEGAMNFNNNSGTVFSYVLMVPGEYDYQCNTHFADGMTGSIVAVAVNTSLPVMNNVKPVYIVQEQGQNVLYSSITDMKNSSGDYTLSIFDVSGKRVVSTNVNVLNNRYVLPELVSGVYVVWVMENEKPILSTKIWQQ